MRRKMTSLMKAIGLMGLVLSLLLFAGGKPSQAAEPIKIGVVVSTTGMFNWLGNPEIKAITVVADEVNRQGGLFGRPIKLFVEDDQSNATTSTIAATKLIRDEKVSCIIGASGVDGAMAMIPICEREGVSQLPLVPLTIPLKKWVFLTCLDDYFLSDKMVAFTVKELGARKIANLHDASIYGLKGANGVKDHAGKHGATIVIDEQFEQTDTNMIPQLTKTKAAKPDAIVLFTGATSAAVIAKNMQQLGMKMRVVTGGGVPSKEFPQLAGKTVENGRWVPFDPMDLYAEQLPPNDPFRKNLYDPLFKAIKAKYGENTEWDGFFRNGNDPIHIVIEALKIAKTDDRVALRDALEKVKYDGFLGDFAYSPKDHLGTTGETFVPIIIKDGKYWPYPYKKK
ncbi:MAG: ABC transporter substrate-binding protein [Thermodesulfobacteriota bacterium]